MNLYLFPVVLAAPIAVAQPCLTEAVANGAISESVLEAPFAAGTQWELRVVYDASVEPDSLEPGSRNILTAIYQTAIREATFSVDDASIGFLDFYIRVHQAGTSERIELVLVGVNGFDPISAAIVSLQTVGMDIIDDVDLPTSVTLADFEASGSSRYEARFDLRVEDGVLPTNLRPPAFPGDANGGISAFAATTTLPGPADAASFLALFESGDPEADVAEPFGRLDVADIIGFLQRLGAGCP